MAEFDWSKVSALLDELFELDAGERAQRLAAIAAADAVLGAQLRRLLEADATDGLLDGAVADIVPTMMERLSAPETDTSGSAAPAMTGRQLGHYRLVERIGNGGMGEVWRGERVDGFEQSVAIKLIRPVMDSPDLRQRFARERRILARLDHPNIARLLDSGVSAEGVPWFAMEFVRGNDVLRHAQTLRLDARARIGLVLQICDAVAYAQAQLVVHRDIKPSNLLVDEGGRVRVLDFGIARLLDDSLESRLTRTGVRVYSPAYAAPEQIRGGVVGTAADVFSLGVVLFELLTGEVPYPQRSTAPDRLLEGLDRETAPRPSQRLRERSRVRRDTGLASMARDLTGDLDLIVATALRPDPARRYAGVAQLGDDLRRWLDGRPVAARADTAGYRMRRFVSRHRLAVGSATAVLLALLGGLGLTLWQRDVAREEARRADAEAARVERTYRFVLSIFQNVSPVRGGGESPQGTVEVLLRDGLDRLDSELADMPDIRAGLRGALAEPLLAMGHIEEAYPHLLRAVDELSASATPDVGDISDLASALLNLAGAEKDAARLDAAIAHAERALTLYTELPGEHPRERIQARTLLANLATQQQRSDEAIAQHLRILQERRQLPGWVAADSAVDYNNLAAAYPYADRFSEAEQRYHELDRLLRESPDVPPSRRVYSLAGLAWSQFGQGRYDEAGKVVEEVLALGRDTLSPTHPTVSGMSLLRARIAAMRADWNVADRLFAEALAVIPATIQGNAHLYWCLALYAQQRDDEAAQHIEQARALLASATGAGSALSQLAETAAAVIAHRRGHGPLAAVDTALAGFDALPGADDDKRILALQLAADAHAHAGDAAAAIRLDERARAMAQRLQGPTHPLIRAPRDQRI